MLVALVSAGLMAAAPSAEAMLARADVNNDGRVTRAEFIDARAATFTRMDRNRDGYLTHADVGPRAARRLAASGQPDIFGQFDDNRDGRVSRQEFATGPAVAFDMADRNRDGVVDRAEMAAVREAAEQRRAY